MNSPHHGALLVLLRTWVTEEAKKLSMHEPLKSHCMPQKSNTDGGLCADCADAPKPSSAEGPLRCQRQAQDLGVFGKFGSFRRVFWQNLRSATQPSPSSSLHAPEVPTLRPTKLTLPPNHTLQRSSEATLVFQGPACPSTRASASS